MPVYCEGAMSFRHLDEIQNTEVAKLLLALAKTMILASVIAVLFPTGGGERPFGTAIIGAGLGAVAAILGVKLLKGTGREGNQPVKKRRR